MAIDPAMADLEAARRAAIRVDAGALGILRKDLIERLGLEMARFVLTRFGYVQGWNAANWPESGRSESQEERLRAAARVPVIEGLCLAVPADPGLLSPDGSALARSYEADQHLRTLGPCDTPTCWVICGLASGYLSRLLDRELFVLEDRCIGRGDPACHLAARTREEWGEARADELRFFRREPPKGRPDASLQRVTRTLKRAEQRMRARHRILPRGIPHVDVRGPSHADEPVGMVARSDAMRRLVELARRFAKVDSTVLITGESGSGKERIARLVHAESPRAAGPFVAVNCGAITETLLESELFGHARGAFTGAVADRPGLFESAAGGTLLLDEIGEMSPGIQVKLLRALQEREVRRVGENHSRPTDVRVIAATNSDLDAEIAARRFRKDLFYRLNVVALRVPPLRDRREDILPLARALLADAASRMKRPLTRLSPRAAGQLLRYDWPGNVRELENAMERAIALSNGRAIEPEDLPEEVREAIAAPAVSGPVKVLHDMERDYILAVLRQNDGNQARTAAMLDIGTATLYRKLKQYGALRRK